MRQEQDSLGEVRLSDEEYFGISTARLLAVADSFGPRIPQRLAKNIVRVRQAQALARGRSAAVCHWRQDGQRRGAGAA